ncbi:hypothetical protein SOVF_200100, partial [Spinacia oleracea]
MKESQRSAPYSN